MSIEILSLGGNAIIPNHFLTTVMPNAKPVNVFTAGLPIGDNDLYTVPANRRAAVYAHDMTCPVGSVGTINAFPEVKIAGTYIRLNLTAPIGIGQRLGQDIAYVLNAGETYSINVATNAGLSEFANIIEFDASSPLRSVMFNNLIVGDTVVYTVPPGKNATFIAVNSNQFQPVSGLFAPNGIVFINNTGGTVNLKYFAVPFGSTPNNGNSIIPAGLAASSQRNNSVLIANLSSQGFINVNSDTASPNAAGWLNVMEF